MTASIYTSEQIDALLAPITKAIAQLQSAVQALQQQVTALQQPAPSPSNESKEGTKITPGSGSIVDQNGDTWAISSAFFIQKNGANAFNGWQSREGLYHDHTVYILGLDGNWYDWTGSAFVRAIAAPPGA